jgi:hypothetical protein
MQGAWTGRNIARSMALPKILRQTSKRIRDLTLCGFLQLLKNNKSKKDSQKGGSHKDVYITHGRGVL